MVFGIPKLFFPVYNSAIEDDELNHNSDDNTVGENTITSEGTRSILRRRYGGRRMMKKNTERNVSWSNTYDTYDDNGDGNNDTFETLDTFETRDDYDADEYGRDQEEEENLIRDFNFIYPGETDMSYGQTETFDTMRSVSVSSEMDGTVELQQIDHRPMQSEPMQPVVTQGLVSAMSSPLPPPTMAPKPVERKQLDAALVADASFMRLTPPELHHMNLACSSTLSEGTIEARKDRYEGLCKAESEDTYCNWASQRAKENRQRANPAAITSSDVFIPRQSNEPPPHSIIHALASKSDSNSDDDITLDSIIDDIYNDTPSYGMNRIRAASDDESIVSLTKRDEKLNLLFESQKQVDTIAGHIGLILPFLDQIKSDTELMAKDVMNRMTASNTISSKSNGGNDAQNSASSKTAKNQMFDMKNLFESVAKSASTDCDVLNFSNGIEIDASDDNNNLQTGEGDAPSDDSDESYEISEYGAAPVKGEVIRIQDLGSTKHGRVREVTSSTDDDNGLVDRTATNKPDQNSSKKSVGKWLPWGWRKKCKSTTNTHPSDRFDPIPLPQGCVDDDDLSCSGSCITTESILSELKVIENTAKLMYQQLCSSAPGELDTSPEYISSLLSSTATELVLECGPQEEKDDEAGKTKKGKLRELFGKCIPKKKLNCGPVCGVTVTWDPTQEETTLDHS